MTRKTPNLIGGLTRRDTIRALAGGALAYPAASMAGWFASASSASAQDVEVVEITPDLIEAAQAEGEVFLRYSSPTNVYVHHAEMFEEQYGIRVITDRKVGPVGQQVFAQEERAGRHVMDVVETGDAQGLFELDSEGLYLHFTLPDLKNTLRERFFIPNLAYCPFKNSMLIAYNPQVLPHEDAKRIFSTWEGVFDPAMEGRMGTTDPAKTAVSFGQNLMWYSTPEYGMEFIERLGQTGLRVYPGSAHAREDLAAGAISAFIAGWEGAEMERFVSGVNVAWTYADIQPDYPNIFMAVSKNAPHPNAARLFTAWLFSEKGIEAYAKSQNYTTVIGAPDLRSGLPLLKETEWWEPYPVERGYVPDLKTWVAEYGPLSVKFSNALQGR